MKVVNAGGAASVSRLVVAGFICICVSSEVAAQNNVTRRRPKPHTCEEAMLYLDMSASEAGKDEDGYVIAVARLGDGERAPELNRRRLRFVKDYSINVRRWDKIVTASGERVGGRGRVELYAGGKLLYVLLYPKRGYISCAKLG